MANYPWIQTTPGKYQQEYGTFERLHAIMSSLCGAAVPHWTVLSLVSVRFTRPWAEFEANLRRAWIAFRYHNPALACLEGAGYRVYEAVDAKDTTRLDQWLDESFFIHDDHATQFLAKLAKTKFATLHCFPASNELLLQCSHIHADGRGMAMFWHEFLSLVAHPPAVHFGDEGKNLSLLQDDILGWPTLPNIIAEQQQFSKQVLDSFKNTDPIRLPIDHYDQTPLHTFRAEVKLSPDETAAVLSACKKRGVTVTVAWHAAVMLTIQDIQRQTTGIKRERYSSSIQVDMRRFFPPDFPTRDHAIMAYNSCILFNVKVDDFISTLERLKPIYEDIASGHSKQLQASTPLIHELSLRLSNGLPKSSTSNLSSLGILDKYVKTSYGDDLEVEDVWIHQTLMSAESQMCLWTWRERLVLSGSANWAFHAPEDVTKLLLAIGERLMKELDIGCQGDRPI